jgi:hypothetical protein
MRRSSSAGAQPTARQIEFRRPREQEEETCEPVLFAIAVISVGPFAGIFVTSEIHDSQSGQ